MSVLAYLGYATALQLVAFIVLPAVGLWWVARAGAGVGIHLQVVAVLVILLSDLTLRGRADGLDSQSAMKFGLWLSGLLLLAWRPELLRTARRDVPTFALLVFGLWALASTIYSEARLYTFAASLSFLGLWVTAVAMATSMAPARGLSWVTGTLFAMSAASLLLYFVSPSTAMVLYENSTTLRLGGIFGNANALGGVASLALLLTALSWLSPTTRLSVWLTLVVVPICLACLVLSQSRTAMLGLTAGLTAVLIRRQPLLLLPTVLLSISAAIVIIGYPGVFDTVVELVARSGRVSQVTTFTGRTEIWAFVVSAIREAPLLGYGFASTKEVIPAGYSGPYGWTTSSAHNLWLQTWVTTGAVGLLMVLTSQLGNLKALVLRPQPLRDGVCVYVLFFGLLEAGPMGPSVNLLTFIWIWATATTLWAEPGAVDPAAEPKAAHANR